MREMEQKYFISKLEMRRGMMEKEVQKCRCEKECIVNSIEGNIMRVNCLR